MNGGDADFEAVADAIDREDPDDYDPADMIQVTDELQAVSRAMADGGWLLTAIDDALKAGHTWTEIGAMIGMSGDEAQGRFALTEFYADPHRWTTSRE